MPHNRQPPPSARVSQIGVPTIARFGIPAHRCVVHFVYLDFCSGMLGERNYVGLTETQIGRCLVVWGSLCGDDERDLDVSEAAYHGSRTRYDEDRGTVILGANAYAGIGASANARMSMRACLAHELAHMLRAELGFNRPFTPPDVHLDEAETSIHASFCEGVSLRDREDLVEDARDRLFDWLAFPKEKFHAN